MGRLSRELLGGGEPAPSPAPSPAPTPAPAPVVEPEPEVLESQGMETADSEALGSEDE